VRELGNFIERTLIFCRSPRIGLKDLPWEVRRRNRDQLDDLSLKKAIVRMEREFIQRALARTDGNRTHAAELLEISLRALLYKIKEYNLQG
jgi:two-component system response regulator AtoC